MRRAVVVIIAIMFIIFFSSCGKKPEKKILLSINGRPLTVEVAHTPKQRQRGLMNRKTLGSNEGMLFVFDKEEFLSFWMKDTMIPLSIAFLDKNGYVVDIFDMQPFSLTPVRSSRKCKYAIEANQGFFSKSGIKRGDKINLDSVE